MKSEWWSGLLYVILTGKVMRSLDRAPLTSPRRNNEQPLALSCHFKPRLSNGLPERLAAPTMLPHGEELSKKSTEKRKDPVRVHSRSALSAACLFRLFSSCLAALSNLFALPAVPRPSLSDWPPTPPYTTSTLFQRAALPHFMCWPTWSR